MVLAQNFKEARAAAPTSNMADAMPGSPPQGTQNRLNSGSAHFDAPPPEKRLGGILRRLWSADYEPFKEHLLRLDEASRADRFAMVVSDDFLRQYADNCFGLDDIIYGYVEEGYVRGAGELRQIDSGAHIGSEFGLVAFHHPRQAEAAFSVENDWRRRGIGKELLSRIVRAARNRRIDTLYMTCLARNRAMQALARHFEAELHFETDDVTGKLIARSPTALSILGEALSDMGDFATAMLDVQRRAFHAATTSKG